MRIFGSVNNPNLLSNQPPHTCGRAYLLLARRLFSEAIFAMAVIGLMLVVIGLAMWEIGEGRVKAGPLEAKAEDHIPLDVVAKRMEYHGTLVAHKCNRPSGWCFVRSGIDRDVNAAINILEYAKQSEAGPASAWRGGPPPQRSAKPCAW